MIAVDARNAHDKSVPCEMLLLPLRHSGPDYDRLFGCCAPLERPYWLGSEPIVRQSLTSLRLIWPDERPSFLRRASDRVEPAPPIPFPLPDRRRRGHLTLLDGGKQ